MRVAVAEPPFLKNDLQLCAQVAQALHLALLEIDDPRLARVALLEVKPAPDASRLCVVASVDAPPEVEPARAALAACAARLRRDVAAAIHRSRAPELAFVVLPPRGGACR